MTVPMLQNVDSRATFETEGLQFVLRITEKATNWIISRVFCFRCSHTSAKTVILINVHFYRDRSKLDRPTRFIVFETKSFSEFITWGMSNIKQAVQEILGYFFYVQTITVVNGVNMLLSIFFKDFKITRYNNDQALSGRYQFEFFGLVYHREMNAISGTHCFHKKPCTELRYLNRKCSESLQTRP